MLPSSLSLPAAQPGRDGRSGRLAYQAELAEGRGIFMEGTPEGRRQAGYQLASACCTTTTSAQQRSSNLAAAPAPSPIISSLSFSRRSITTGVSRLTTLPATLLAGSSSSTCGQGASRKRCRGRRGSAWPETQLHSDHSHWRKSLAGSGVGHSSNEQRLHVRALPHSEHPAAGHPPTFSASASARSRSSRLS